jgi:SHS2 domain-containing protein
MKRFEQIEHTADQALRIFGPDLEGLLRHAALGLNRLMDPNPTAPAAAVEKEIDIAADDAEALLVSWLSELVFWAETELLVFTVFEFRGVAPNRLRVRVRGGRARRLRKHVKAVTFHNLEIVCTGQGCTATVVFDV